MALLSGPTISTAINQPTNALAKLVESEKDDRKLIDDVFMRVLNRPATKSEVTNTLALMAEVDQDRGVVTNDLSNLETKLAPSIAKLKTDREDAIAHAKTNLAVYTEMTATLLPELEKRHQNEIALTKRELTEYEKIDSSAGSIARNEDTIRRKPKRFG